MNLHKEPVKIMLLDSGVPEINAVYQEFATILGNNISELCFRKRVMVDPDILGTSIGVVLSAHILFMKESMLLGLLLEPAYRESNAMRAYLEISAQRFVDFLLKDPDASREARAAFADHVIDCPQCQACLKAEKAPNYANN